MKLKVTSDELYVTGRTYPVPVVNSLAATASPPSEPAGIVLSEPSKGSVTLVHSEAASLYAMERVWLPHPSAFDEKSALSYTLRNCTSEIVIVKSESNPLLNTAFTFDKICLKLSDTSEFPVSLATIEADSAKIKSC